MVSQHGFFDLDDRYAALSKAGDPLVRLKEIVPFEPYFSMTSHSKSLLWSRSQSRVDYGGFGKHG